MIFITSSITLTNKWCCKVTCWWWTCWWSWPRQEPKRMVFYWVCNFDTKLFKANFSVLLNLLDTSSKICRLFIPSFLLAHKSFSEIKIYTRVWFWYWIILRTVLNYFLTEILLQNNNSFKEEPFCKHYNSLKSKSENIEMLIWPELDSLLSIAVVTSVDSVELSTKVSSSVLPIPLSELVTVTGSVPEAVPELSGPPQQTSERIFGIQFT